MGWHQSYQLGLSEMIYELGPNTRRNKKKIKKMPRESAQPPAKGRKDAMRLASPAARLLLLCIKLLAATHKTKQTSLPKQKRGGWKGAAWWGSCLGEPCSPGTVSGSPGSSAAEPSSSNVSCIKCSRRPARETWMCLRLIACARWACFFFFIWSTFFRC